MNQILPGDLYGFLGTTNIVFVRVFEFLNAVLELAKPGADILKLPVMLELDVDLLPGKAVLEGRYAA